MTALTFTLPPDVVEEIAERVAEIILGREPPPDAARLLSTAEAADRVGVHPRTVARAVEAGQLQASKIGGRWRIDPADLDCWLAAGRRKTPAAAAPARRRTPPGRPLTSALQAQATRTASSAGPLVSADLTEGSA